MVGHHGLYKDKYKFSHIYSSSLRHCRRCWDQQLLASCWWRPWTSNGICIFNTPSVAWDQSLAGKKLDLSLDVDQCAEMLSVPVLLPARFCEIPSPSLPPLHTASDEWWQLSQHQTQKSLPSGGAIIMHTKLLLCSIQVRQSILK